MHGLNFCGPIAAYRKLNTQPDGRRDHQIRATCPGRPGHRIGQIAFGHDPSDDIGDAELMLCGHIHPAMRFGRRSDQIKLPCFWHTNSRLVFPAIGQFTGTHLIRPGKDDRVWVVADEGVFEQSPKMSDQRLT